MYQGKFSAKNRGQASGEEAVKQIIETRNARNAARAAKIAKRKGIPLPPEEPQKPARHFEATPEKKAELPKLKQSEDTKVKKAAAPKAKQKSRMGFWKFYGLFVALFCVLTGIMMIWLQGWLKNYEAAQPTLKCQQVFDELFANPDWEGLYELAGMDGTSYEGKEQFAEYMSAKVGNQKLNYVETSAGLSDDKKYFVRLDNENLATFTLEDHRGALSSIPDWEFGKLELVFSRQSGYLIQKLDGHTAYVNGIPLDESYTIQIASTSAEKFLPIGTPGIRICLQKITGLMMQPTVTAFGPTGEEFEVIYDEATGTFTEQTSANAITEEFQELALNTVKAYSEFMINAAGGRPGVARYFDGTSELYADIIAMGKELWMNADYGHRFTDETVTEYTRYSETLFSARAHVTMLTTLKDGSNRPFEIDQTLFFRQKTDGTWVCYQMTNEDISKPVGQVRLTFMNDTELLTTGFYDTDSTELLTPLVSAPAGKVFSGWVKETYDNNGRRTLTLMFTPDETGHVALSGTNSLEPMTLYAFFENAE